MAATKPITRVKKRMGRRYEHLFSVSGQPSDKELKEMILRAGGEPGEYEAFCATGKATRTNKAGKRVSTPVTKRRTVIVEPFDQYDFAQSTGAAPEPAAPTPTREIIKEAAPGFQLDQVMGVVDRFVGDKFHNLERELIRMSGVLESMKNEIEGLYNYIDQPAESERKDPLETIAGIFAARAGNGESGDKGGFDVKL